MDGLYKGGGDKAEAPGGPKQSVDEENAESPQALLPKSILGGKKFEVGDEVVLKIVGDHGDEVSVEYAPEEGPSSEGKSANDELDEMSQEPAGAGMKY